MDQGRFGEAQLGRDVPRHAEIRVLGNGEEGESRISTHNAVKTDLIDGAGNEAGHGAAPEWDRKGAVQGGGCLDGWE